MMKIREIIKEMITRKEENKENNKNKSHLNGSKESPINLK